MSDGVETNAGETSEPASGGEEMHIHRPKPLHGLREILTEIGIIVIGIAIALGGEQTIESLRQERVTEETRRDVRQEAAINLGFLQDRAEEASCVAQRLDALGSILRRQDGGAPGSKPIWVGRPSNVPVFVERWRSVTSSGRTALFTPDEQANFDNLYAVFDRFQQEEIREQAAWTKLRVLERWDGPIDAAARLSLLEAVEEARHQDSEIRQSAFYGFGIARNLKLTANSNYFGPLRASRQICIPVDTPLQKALAEQRDRIPNSD